MHDERMEKNPIVDLVNSKNKQKKIWLTICPQYW